MKAELGYSTDFANNFLSGCEKLNLDHEFWYSLTTGCSTEA